MCCAQLLVMCKILYFNFFIFASFVFFFQVNGEIYNHEELRSKLKSHKFRTGSDCEVIAHLVSIDSIFLPLSLHNFCQMHLIVVSWHLLFFKI